MEAKQLPNLRATLRTSVKDMCTKIRDGTPSDSDSLALLRAMNDSLTFNAKFELLLQSLWRGAFAISAMKPISRQEF